MYEKHLGPLGKKEKRLRKKDNPVIVEIGARDGKETLGFLKHFPNATIYTFECNPDTIPLCEKAYEGINNILFFKKAVSEKTGMVDFYKIDTTQTKTVHADGNPGASSLFQANSEYKPEQYVQEKISVESVRLDDFMKEQNIEVVDILWMDTQGSELPIMQSIGDRIQNIKIICTEAEFFPVYQKQPLYQDIKSFLNNQGFFVHTFSRPGMYATDLMFVKSKYKFRQIIADGIFSLIHINMNNLKQKTFSIVRKLGLFGSILFFILYFIKNMWNFLFDRFSHKKYANYIKNSIKRKKIVLDIPYQGLGDWVVFASLPRLLHEKYDANFYITKKSYEKLKNKDIAELLFLRNPYFKGFVEEDGMVFRIFSKDKKWQQIFFTQGCDSITEIIEKQFGLESVGKGIPEIFYTPQKISEYENTILVDSNYISGKKVGWKYSQKTFQNYISRFQTKETHVEYVDVLKQDLYRYVDIMHSSKHFITVLSGGAAVHACFDKEYVCILPYNAFGVSVDQFVFKKSQAIYAK